MTDSASSVEPVKGVIGRSLEQGLPVVWTFVPQLPSPAVRQAMPWLTVVSWSYDGSSNNGMPDEPLQVVMRELESALLPLEESAFSLEAYRRTGNSLKEFAFYTSSQEQFMDGFNELLAEHPRYPLGIKFYEDPDWSDFAELIADFQKPNPSVKGTSRKRAAPYVER